MSESLPLAAQTQARSHWLSATTTQTECLIQLVALALRQGEQRHWRGEQHSGEGEQNANTAPESDRQGCGTGLMDALFVPSLYSTSERVHCTCILVTLLCTGGGGGGGEREV